MIKIIATDFDWTLIDHSGKGFLINRELKAFFDAYIEDGNYVGIVSGRIYPEMTEIINNMGYAWGNPYPNFTVYKEAYLADIIDGKKHDFTQNELTRKRVLSVVRKITRFVDEWIGEVEKQGIYCREWKVGCDSNFDMNFKTLADSEKAGEIIANCVANTELCDVCRVTRNALIVGVAVKEINKGTALLAFAKEKGIAPNEILAIGDSFNDESMTDGKLGFLGGCVGNGEENLKNIVRVGGGYIGEGVASDSVLDIIKKVQKDALLPIYRA
jgi:Predicted hydrolases of the HAD superfamily